MIINLCHPAWPQHADFSCPSCGNLYQDGDEYYEDGRGIDDAESSIKCLNCNNSFRVCRIVPVTYHTETICSKITHD